MALLGKASSTSYSSTPGIPSPSGRGEPYLLKRPNVSCDSLSEDLYPGNGQFHPQISTYIEGNPCCLSSEWSIPF